MRLEGGRNGPCVGEGEDDRRLSPCASLTDNFGKLTSGHKPF